MMAIKIIYLFVALLPSVIYGQYEKSPFKNVLIEIDDIASADTMNLINGVFKPSPNGYLGEGESYFVYKGLFIPTSKKVAMKFTTKEEMFDAANEYATYYYLGAVNGTDTMKNSEVEAYGIPSVHYSGAWDNYFLLATTLLDAECTKRVKENEINELDLIIMFREFVRITKYIHGKGVLHGNIKLNAIMFRQHQGFMIDFAAATKLFGGAHKNLNDLSDANGSVAHQVKCEWKEFLLSALKYICSRSKWIDADADYLRKHLLELESMGDNATNPNIMEKIRDEGLRNVILEFAKYINKGAETIRDSFYDQVYKVINTEIARMCPDKVALVSWLDTQQKENARKELHIHPIPPIGNLVNPYGCQNPKYPKYPTVDFDYFCNLYHVPISGARKPIAPLERCASFKKAMKLMKDST